MCIPAFNHQVFVLSSTPIIRFVMRNPHNKVGFIKKGKARYCGGALMHLTADGRCGEIKTENVGHFHTEKG